MKFGRLATDYFVWHYSTAFFDLWRVFTNFLWFIYSLFSISFLLETFFDPFERRQETHRSSDDIDDFLSSIVVNILMRMVGVVMRFFIILFGIVLLILTLILGLLAFVLWPLLPLVVVAMFVLSMFLLV